MGKFNACIRAALVVCSPRVLRGSQAVLIYIYSCSLSKVIKTSAAMSCTGYQPSQMPRKSPSRLSSIIVAQNDLVIYVIAHPLATPRLSSQLQEQLNNRVPTPIRPKRNHRTELNLASVVRAGTKSDIKYSALNKNVCYNVA